MANIHTGPNAIIPASKSKNVTPSDSTNFDFVTKGLYVGSAGNISVEMVHSGNSTKTTVFTGVLGGTILPIQITRVNSTSTTASSMVALY